MHERFFSSNSMGKIKNCGNCVSQNYQPILMWLNYKRKNRKNGVHGGIDFSITFFENFSKLYKFAKAFEKVLVKSLLCASLTFTFRL